MPREPTLIICAMIADRLAALLIQARRDRRQFHLADLGGDLATIEEAYRVQDRVATALGWFELKRASAWKAGASAPGAAPIAVPLPPSGVIDSPARFSRGTFHSIRIEAEIAFRFGDGVTPARAESEPWTTWIRELVVTIEVVDARIADGDRASALVKLADAQTHGALVVGSAIPAREIAWNQLRAIVRRNESVVADARGGHPLGDPSMLLPWFVRHATGRGTVIRSGDIVTAGTWAGMLPAQAGDAIDVEFEGVGKAQAQFD